jgi:hypothetical protein
LPTDLDSVVVVFVVVGFEFLILSSWRIEEKKKRGDRGVVDTLNW